MISRSDYTEDEWAEVIARCKLLTEGHEWVDGDLNWNGTCVQILGSPIRYIDGMIWLAHLDQLVRMDGWNNENWSLLYYDGIWEVNDEGVENDMTGNISQNKHVRLAALRALQRCGEECNQIDLRTHPDVNPHRYSKPKPQCAGIHPPDGPHRCLDHALAQMEVTA